MLGNSTLIAFVSTTDADRARHFFRELLGLRLVAQSTFALEFDCLGTMLRVTLAESVEPAPYAVLGWLVSDIKLTVGALTNAGIVVERFEGVVQSQEGIWTAPGGGKVAWFRDPDGNLLSVSQF